VCTGEGGDRGSGANLNALLGRYGVMVNADALISIVQQGSRHPQEVLVSQGLLCTVTAAAAAQASAAAAALHLATPAAHQAAERAAQPAGGGAGTSGTAQSALRSASGRLTAGAPAAAAAAAAAPPLELVYVSGCTLAVSRAAAGAAHPVLVSGSMCNPPQRPLGAEFCISLESQKGAFVLTAPMRDCRSACVTLQQRTSMQCAGKG